MAVSTKVYLQQALNIEMVKYLLDKGADPDNNNGHHSTSSRCVMFHEQGERVEDVLCCCTNKEIELKRSSVVARSDPFVFLYVRLDFG